MVQLNSCPKESADPIMNVGGGGIRSGRLSAARHRALRHNNNNKYKNK